MGKDNNIVHQYFKKELPDLKILVKLNPIHLTGTEITIQQGNLQIRDLQFDEAILDDLAADGFSEVNALEFNLYLSGLV